MDNLIIVDENDNVLGTETKKNCHSWKNIEKGLLHRAFSVFLFDNQNRLLLQQRSSQKVTFPLLWSNTCCSHMAYIQEEMIEKDQLGAKIAAKRRMKEELGLDIPLNLFTFMGKIYYKARSDELWGEHEIDYIFFVDYNPENIPLDPTECHSVKFVTLKELEILIHEENVTPWFKLIYEKHLCTWWKSSTRPYFKTL